MQNPGTVHIVSEVWNCSDYHLPVPEQHSIDSLYDIMLSWCFVILFQSTITQSSNHATWFVRSHVLNVNNCQLPGGTFQHQHRGEGSTSWWSARTCYALNFVVKIFNNYFPRNWWIFLLLFGMSQSLTGFLTVSHFSVTICFGLHRWGRTSSCQRTTPPSWETLMSGLRLEKPMPPSNSVYLQLSDLQVWFNKENYCIKYESYMNHINYEGPSNIINHYIL